MRRPPPISTFLRYPATAGTALLSLGLTLAWWAEVDMSAIVQNALITRGQVWRLLTSTLLHGDPLHLAFNLYWLWVFGTLVEEKFGSPALLGIMVFLGLGSSAAEFAVLHGGVGLSGIGYGLLGMLWVISRDDERFAEAVDAKTIQLFVLWFFFCIALTVTGAMGVANIAHGVGAALGALLGWAVSWGGRRRFAAPIAAGTSLVVLLALGTAGRPFVNRSPHRGVEESYWGYQALEKKQNKEAAGWYRDATRMAPANADHWFNLGIAYHRMNDFPRAAHAYGEASRLAPSNLTYRLTFGGMKLYLQAATRPS